VIAESKGGEMKLENMRPICKKCNASMGNKNMDNFIEERGFFKQNNWYGICNVTRYNENKLFEEKLKKWEKELNEKNEKLNNMDKEIKIREKEIKQEEKKDFLFSKIVECKINNHVIKKLKFFSIIVVIIKYIDNIENIKKAIDEKKISLNYVIGKQNTFGYKYIKLISIQRIDATKSLEVIKQLCINFNISFYIKIKLFGNEIFEWKNL